MGLSVFQGTLTSPASTGSVTYSDAGFRPLAVIFWTSSDTASGDAADHNICIGFTSENAFWQSVNNVGTTFVFGDGNTTGGNAFAQTNSGSLNTFQIGANFTTFTDSGFTLNWLNVTSGAIVHYLAIGGEDLVNAAVGSTNPPSVTGNASVTVGFQPDIVLFSTYNSLGSSTASGRIGFGAATSSTSRFLCSISGTGGATMASTNLVSRVQDATKCCGLLALGGGTTYEGVADFVSMDTNGFTLNWTAVPANPVPFVLNYLALKGGTYSVGSFTKNANTTDTSVTVNAGLSVAPVAYMMFAAAGTNNTPQSTGARFGIGATDGTNANSVCGETTNGVATSRSRSFTDGSGGGNHATLRQRALPASTTTAGAVEVVFNHSSFNASGFVVSYVTNATTTQYIFPYITFGPEPDPFPLAYRQWITFPWVRPALARFSLLPLLKPVWKYARALMKARTADSTQVDWHSHERRTSICHV